VDHCAVVCLVLSLTVRTDLLIYDVNKQRLLRRKIPYVQWLEAKAGLSELKESVQAARGVVQQAEQDAAPALEQLKQYIKQRDDANKATDPVKRRTATVRLERESIRGEITANVQTLHRQCLLSAALLRIVSIVLHPVGD